MRAAALFGVAPHEYEGWPEKSRRLAEALVELDASTNQYGIPLERARDEELGWDVDFVTDYTVAAVKEQAKSRYGQDGPPDGASPVVTENVKTRERVQAQRLATEGPGPAS